MQVNIDKVRHFKGHKYKKNRGLSSFIHLREIQLSAASTQQPNVSLLNVHKKKKIIFKYCIDKIMSAETPLIMDKCIALRGV